MVHTEHVDGEFKNCMTLRCCFWNLACFTVSRVREDRYRPGMVPTGRVEEGSDVNPFSPLLGACGA